MLHARERIVVVEGIDEKEVAVRERAPLLALMPVFSPLGARQGEWEAARVVEAKYLAPERRSA